MTGFLGELGKKLAERWVTLLVLPGLLYVAVAAVAVVLGQGRATDLAALRAWVDSLAAAPASNSPGAVLAGGVGILIGAAGAGLAAAALGQLVQRVWTTPGRQAPFRWLVDRRRNRWDDAYKAVGTAMRATHDATRSHRSRDPEAPDLGEAVSACARICLVRPDRPTWIGDRLRAIDERIYSTYRLDLSAAWPRLWMLIPDTVRGEVSIAHDSYTAAARLAGWSVLYFCVGSWWWPALVIAAGIGTTAWIRGRTATAVLADLVESAVDLHGAELARQLGIDCPDTLTPEAGEAITTVTRKDQTLHGRWTS